MKKKFLLLLILFNFTFLLSQNLRELKILHWNDFHSANIPFKVTKKEIPELSDSLGFIGGYAYLSAYLNKFKDTNTITLHAGDDFQGSPSSTVTKGKSQIDILNLILPDAFTIGNHEFDYSLDTLLKNLKDAKFNVINCNLIDKETKNNIFKPYQIFERNNIKIAVIGVITRDLITLTLKDNIKNITILKEIPTIRKYIKEISESENPDIFILLSHCGYEDDIIIADSIPELSVIIGGHSHTRIKNPKKENKTIICQAGEKGKYLGVLDLKIDIDGDSVYSYEGKLVPTINEGITPDSIVSNKINEIESESLKGLNEVIGVLKSDWIRSHDKESNIGNWMSDVIRKFTKADIAFQNSGGIRKNLSAGNITIRDIWEIAPFDNTIVYFKIRGDSIIKLIEHQLNGFAEKLQVSGLKYKYDDSKPLNNRLIEVRVNGKKLNPKKYYIVATNNYVASQGKKYFGFNINPSIITDTQKEGKELFIEYVKKQKVINSRIENRMIKVNKWNIF